MMMYLAIQICDANQSSLLSVIKNSVIWLHFEKILAVWNVILKDESLGSEFYSSLFLLKTDDDMLTKIDILEALRVCTFVNLCVSVKI